MLSPESRCINGPRTSLYPWYTLFLRFKASQHPQLWRKGLFFRKKTLGRKKANFNWKINIVKTLGRCLSSYIEFLILTVSKSLIDTINNLKIIFRFVWEGKPPKIKKKTIIGEKHCRGLKMIEFEPTERSLKVASSKCITDSGNASWKIIPNQALSQMGSWIAQWMRLRS